MKSIRIFFTPDGFKQSMNKLKPKNIWKAIKPFLTWKMALSFGIAWIITNGWAYLMLGAGTYWNISWMKTIAGIYLAFLWMPWTPEKLITVPMGIWFHKLFFGHKPAITKEELLK